MNLLLIAFLTTSALLAINDAQPVGAEDAIVEIIKQKLVKFPDEIDQQRLPNQTKSNDDEAKRILAQIEKVNQALGYVKKQPEQSRTPPILDSSQYLFPKPAYHPFHEHNHQIAGSHGETLLVPSIRAFRVPGGGANGMADGRRGGEFVGNRAINYNVPPRRQSTSNTLLNTVEESRTHNQHQQTITTTEQPLTSQHYNVPPIRRPNLNNYKHQIVDQLPTPNLHLSLQEVYNLSMNSQANAAEHLAKDVDKTASTINQHFSTERKEETPTTNNKQHKNKQQQYSQQQQFTQQQHESVPFHYVFRPQHVQLPAEQQQQLPTHYAIPVRLYKLNKLEYVQKVNPQEYNNKGYKIVGDIDHFYSKTKQKAQKTNSKTQSTPKYHLFFLPREFLLNEKSTPTSTATTINSVTNTSKNTSSNTKNTKDNNSNNNNNNTNKSNKNTNNNTSSNSNSNNNSNNKENYSNDNTRNNNNSSKHEVPEPQIVSVSNDVVGTPFKVNSTASREEKLANRPFKIQATASSTISNQNGGFSNTTTNTQIIRKRIVPKPLRPKDPPSTEENGIGSPASSTSIKITPAPIPLQTQNAQHVQNVPTTQNFQNVPSIQNVQNVPSIQNVQNAPSQSSQVLTVPASAASGTGTGTIIGSGASNIHTNANASPNTNGNPNVNSNANANTNTNTNKLSNNFGFWPLANVRPLANLNNNNNNNVVQNAVQKENSTSSNVIKNALQNIFKLPFRPERPIAALSNGSPSNFQSVPLQVPPQNTFFGLQTRPQTHAVSQLEPQPLQQPILPPQPIYQGADNHDDYSDSSSNSAAEDASDSLDNDEAEQKIFGHHHRQQQQETQKEAIKQGGIIIQRLKVRKGGIAIAGPGGVATAGSGGTAIVGPGGYALTHPRSLTIAGPGAKIIAIPATVDLADALERTNLKDQTFPREGRIVATGPTIYYSPDTGVAVEVHRSNEPIIFEVAPQSNNGAGLRSHISRGRHIHRAGSSEQTQTTSKRLTHNQRPVGVKLTANIRHSGAVSAASGSVQTAVGANDGIAASLITFEQDFNKIQLAAANLVTIQEHAKRKGFFSADDNKIYAESLLELGKAAQKLALLQQTGQIKDFGILLEPVKFMQIPGKEPSLPISMDEGVQNPISVDEVAQNPISEDGTDQKVEEPTEQQMGPQLGPDDFLPPNNEDPYDDSVAVTAPKKDASVAEAKPVGLSIAGEGGVASSKPNAVALSGRNGLAVASPKATAIAGVSPEEAAAFSITLPNNNQLIIKSDGALNRQTSLEQFSLYDDYDYTDLIPVVKRKTSYAPNVNSQSKPPTTDPFINKWKTIIAEDFAESPASGHGVLLKYKRRPKPAQAFLLPTRNVYAA